MKRTLTLFIGALLIGTGSAQAEDLHPTSGGTQLQCKFISSMSKNSKVLARCEATAKVCDLTTRSSSEWNSDRRCNNQLLVSCNGSEVFNSGANVSSIDGFSFITGASAGPTVRVKLEASTRSPVWIADAALNMGGTILEGLCGVQIAPAIATPAPALE